MCYGCIRCGKCRPAEEPSLPLGTCPVCGHPNPQDARRCAECGMPIPAPPGGARASALAPGASNTENC